METVVFVDPGFSAGPFSDALPELRCVEDPVPFTGTPSYDKGDVVALVSGATPIGAAELEGFENLKLVLTASIGTNHLDLEAMAERGLIVCNTPGYCVEEVADHSLAALLSLWRGLPLLERSVREGEWDWNAAGVLRRFSASTLGIIGLGKIGRSLARKAGALGIEVLAHDPHISPEALSEAPGVELCDLDDLLKRSHGVSLHAPIIPGQDRPILRRRELLLMTPGSVLINAARARHVDLDALAELLGNGHLAAASFDVWEDEPPKPGDPRLALPNMQLTPHAAWYSPEADEAYVAEGVAELRATLLQGTGPINAVVGR